MGKSRQPHLKTCAQVETLNRATILPSIRKNSAQQDEEYSHDSEVVGSVQQRQICCPVDADDLGASRTGHTVQKTLPTPNMSCQGLAEQRSEILPHQFGKEPNNKWVYRQCHQHHDQHWVHAAFGGFRVVRNRSRNHIVSAHFALLIYGQWRRRCGHVPWPHFLEMIRWGEWIPTTREILTLHTPICQVSH